jgi:hypothetical protein
VAAAAGAAELGIKTKGLGERGKAAGQNVSRGGASQRLRVEE